MVAIPSPNNDVLTDPMSDNSHTSSIHINEDIAEDDINDRQPSTDYTYIHLSISKAPANIRFAYAHLGNTFQEANTKTSYLLHVIVKLSSGLSAAASCFQFYDISRFKKPPVSPALYEYEPIAQFFLDKNYKLNNHNIYIYIYIFDVSICL